MNEIKTLIIEEGRGALYDDQKFEELFEKMDEDKNGMLSKGEMA
jgi:Ca2+-binding EF-hand superfamily protein